jgi:deazaflavin-dependent oxidoreductase (nitroreductase family)
VAAVSISRTLRFAWWFHRIVLRISNGRIGTRVNGMEVLQLITRGRRSGAARTAALQFLPAGEAQVVIGSNAGDEHHPAWWLNLLADPMARVAVRGRSHAVRAREAVDRERRELLERFIAIDDAYAEYERRTTRRIPVVVLDPVAEGTA